MTLAGITGAVIEAKPLGIGAGVVGLAAGGFLAAVAFVFVEARSAAPMLPLGLFRHRAFSATVAYGVILNLTSYGAIFVLSLYLQRVRGYDPVSTGLAYLPAPHGDLVRLEPR
jgi:MFS transporter, DHA2 family, methylenomycin A resistance protein